MHRQSDQLRRSREESIGRARGPCWHGGQCAGSRRGAVAGDGAPLRWAAWACSAASRRQVTAKRRSAPTQKHARPATVEDTTVRSHCRRTAATVTRPCTRGHAVTDTALTSVSTISPSAATVWPQHRPDRSCPQPTPGHGNRHAWPRGHRDDRPPAARSAFTPVQSPSVTGRLLDHGTPRRPPGG
jgi:hypothetical protein